ncbi:type II toxin-antitoxin system RelB family antitoxin [Staphylococcus argensis]|uniref:CopG family transcriptional regulator n=1 Tax=Staphylococcus argensis TaxID=1607738 RepID=A0A2K4FEI6_9STAP|nr:DUF6290 family protein [Staphylococcus argensis]MCY6991349.1 DUF6290 family protein [Staphylococcus argensis]POA09345.1 CopG family transcriptional regulator [Staphylococcus argensis]
MKHKITVELAAEEMKAIRNYAEIHHIDSSQLMKEATLERIEDEEDLASYKEAMNAYRNDPHTYSPEEVDEILGL